MTTLTLDGQPSHLRLSVRALLARRPALLPNGATVGRITGELTTLRIDPAHLAQYRALCQWKWAGVPLTYPHLLASGLHLAMLTSEAFPLRLLGMVHLGNRIEQRAPLPEALEGRLMATLEGHRESKRGQEFDLITELHLGSEVPWREVSTLLARRPHTQSQAAPTPAPSRPAAQRTVRLEAPTGLGWRYGLLAGDLNPIHLTAATARLFGYQRAIAHGMWSLARCASELEATGACTLAAEFKRPLHFPSSPVLELNTHTFALVAEDKPVLEGSLA